MDIRKHDQKRKYFYTQTNVIASVADQIFSNELQTSTIRCHWHVIFPTITHIQVLTFKKEVKEYLFDLAKKNFNYKLYPYGWTVFEGNQIQAPLGTY